MYQLTGSISLSKNSRPRSTRAEALRVDEETGKTYHDYTHHIDSERTPWNRILVNRDVRDVYREHIGNAIEAYNLKQTATGHPERCKSVEGYMQELIAGEKAGNARKRPRLWNDLIVQCGDMLTNEAWRVIGRDKEMPTLARITNEVYEDFIESFQKTFPNLVVTCAVIHNDESTPHMQVQYVPVSHNNRRGLSTQVKLLDALAEGLDALNVPYNRKKNDGVKHAFNKVLDGLLTDIMRRHGIERVAGNPKEDKQLSSLPVSELRRRNRLLREQVQTIEKKKKNPLESIKAITVPFIGKMYGQRDVEAMVRVMMKERAIIQARADTAEEINRRNESILHEQQKSARFERDSELRAVEQRKKELDAALSETLLLQKKLALTDEQQRYRRLSDDIEKERELLRKQTAESISVLQNAWRDADKIRDDARNEASKLVAEARNEVDALYVELGSSSVVRKKKDDIKLNLLKEQYPDIDDRLDAEAGHEILKLGRSRLQRNNMEINRGQYNKKMLK